MGMYTEIMFRVDIDQEAYAALAMMQEVSGQCIDDEERRSHLPAHPFFAKDRAYQFLLRERSYRFPAPVGTGCALGREDWNEPVSLSLRTHIKNVDGEIEAFLDWITPHIKSGGGGGPHGQFIGYSQYEEDAPVLYFLQHGESAPHVVDVNEVAAS